MSVTESGSRAAEIADAGGSWTVWFDGMTFPLHKAQQRTDAERALLDFEDHDYMYIESPDGEQFAWNHFRCEWEKINGANVSAG